MTDCKTSMNWSYVVKNTGPKCLYSDVETDEIREKIMSLCYCCLKWSHELPNDEVYLIMSPYSHVNIFYTGIYIYSEIYFKWKMMGLSFINFEVINFTNLKPAIYCENCTTVCSAVMLLCYSCSRWCSACRKQWSQSPNHGENTQWTLFVYHLKQLFLH